MNETAGILNRLVEDEKGIQHAEEALLLALIAVAAIVVAQNLGTAVQRTFQEVVDALPA